MGKVRLNLDRFNESRGSKTLAVFAKELGVNAGTISRILTGRLQPGNRFIANCLTALPYSFEQLFTVVDDEEDAA